MNVVGYVRLSREDGNDESISIGTQKKIIRQYARENGYEINEFYEDDGFSGYSFDRPAFNRLKKNLQDNKIDIVIAKDLSRIGRHNAKTLLFIEEVTKLNKMIIFINDDYNNLEDDDDMIGIKTWFNERHVKDTSKKVRNAITAMQQDGEWYSNIPYGYKRNYALKKSFSVDSITSAYVQKIFNMYIDGKGQHTIAKELNDSNIPTPTQAINLHRQEVGLPSIKESKLWSKTIVGRILTNEFYIGTLVQRKTKRMGINGKKIMLDEDQRIKFPNHHEAIIDIETFNLVQNLIAERSKNAYRGNKKYDNIFSGILYCGDCGKTMSPMNGSQKDTVYVCRTYHAHGAKYCNYNKVYEDDLKEVIKVYLQKCRQSLADNIARLDTTIKNEIKQMSGSNSVETLTSLEKQLGSCNAELKSLITQKTKEIIKNPSMSDIIEETYQEMINDKMNMIQMLKTQIEDQKEVAKSTNGMQKNLQTALQMFDTIIATQSFNKKQLHTLIERIDVYYGKGVKIKMRGNLNAIIDEQIDITLNKEQNYLKAIVDKMIELQEFHITDVYNQVKQQGFTQGYYRKCKPIIDRLEEMNIIVRPDNHAKKTKIIKSKDECYHLLEICTDTYTDPRVITYYANIEELILINRWIEENTSITTTGLKNII